MVWQEKVCGRKHQIVGNNVNPKKRVQTQTYKNDFYLLYPEGIPDKESFNNHTDSKNSPEFNLSISPEYSRAAQYISSPPEKAEYFLGTNIFTLCCVAGWT